MAGWRASARHRRDDDFQLLERESRLGGLCRTNWFNGYGFDMSIHILYTADPGLSDLICNHLLQGNYLEQARRSWIYADGCWTQYPFQANLFGRRPDVVRDCLMGLVEAQQQIHLDPPRNFDEWIRRTFGNGIAEHFMLPYNRRVWATPPEEMSFAWIADRVPVPDLASVIDGALQPPTHEYGANSTFWYPIEGGIESIPRGFARELDPVRVRLDTEAVRLELGARRVVTQTGERHEYDRLISTLPLPTLIDLIDDVPPAVRRAAGRLRFNTVYTVCLGVERPAISEQHWAYLPEDQFIFHRISFPMNFSPSMAPEGCSSVMAEISHSDHKSVQGRNLVEETIQGLRQMGVLRDSDRIPVRQVIRLSPAYVIYDLDHAANVALPLRWLAEHDIWSVGRFGEWEYFNMDHAIASGMRAASRQMAPLAVG